MNEVHPGMKVVLFGATGMVGQGVLRECLLDANVASVLAIGRSSSGQRHAKLREILRAGRGANYRDGRHDAAITGAGGRLQVATPVVFDVTQVRYRHVRAPLRR